MIGKFVSRSTTARTPNSQMLASFVVHLDYHTSTRHHNFDGPNTTKVITHHFATTTSKDGKTSTTDDQTVSFFSTSTSAERVTWLSVGSNFALSGGKAAAAYVSGSVALLADAAHSLSDLASDGVTLLSLNLGQRQADRTHPYGYGRYETLGTCGVAGMLLATGVGIGKDFIISPPSAFIHTASAHTNMHELTHTPSNSRTSHPHSHLLSHIYTCI